ncbi:hypothetical protein STEG23_001217 [Scotinomys teguina]
MHLSVYLPRTAYMCAITADLKERSHIDTKALFDGSELDCQTSSTPVHEAMRNVSHSNHSQYHSSVNPPDLPGNLSDQNGPGRARSFTGLEPDK